MKNFCLIVFTLLLFSAGQPKLHKQKLAEGVTAGLPKDFVAMSDNDIAQKYPSTKKPLSMWTSLDRTVDFGLNVSKSTWAGNDLKVLQQVYKATILDLYSNVQFLYEGIEKLNGRDFVLFEFTSVADQTQKYTYLAYSVIGNRVYIFNFSADGRKKDNWRETAYAVIHSIQINQKKLQETVEEFQPVHKGKRPIQVLQEQTSSPGSPKKKNNR